MRYLIDQSPLEPDELLSAYRTVLTWAVAKADRFKMSLEHDVYDEPEDEERLRRLGASETIDPQVGGGLISRLLNRPAVLIRVTGTPSEELVAELTRKGAPARAIAGDLCPAEDFEAFLGDRLLFGCYDYGRVLLLDLAEEEKRTLSALLEQRGLDPKIVRITPESS